MAEPMPLWSPRIAICGSASTGKTTLAAALARDLGVPCIDEEMRAFLRSSRTDLTQLPPSELQETLLGLWHQRRRNEDALPAFVADNSAIDFAAYALYYGCLSASNREVLLTEAAKYLRRYDAIFLLPWGVMPYEQDGVRAPNQDLQLRYQLLLEALLHRYADPETLHVVPETLATPHERMQWVSAKLSHAFTLNAPTKKGRVYLVGAGPGDPDLLTLRAAELVQHADVIAHDLLISPELLARVPPDAELLPVGRRHGMGETGYRLHPAVLERAKAGKTVVRLKCGDPLLFGRGAEEAEDLRNAGIPFEIVPGITAALGAASYAGIPLTHRGKSSQLLLVSGHQRPPKRVSNAAPVSVQERTTVLYMAARRLAANLAEMQSQGYSSDTPAALVLSATTPRQHVICGTVATLGRLVPALPAEIPAILFVGSVIGLRSQLAWFEPGQKTLSATLLRAQQCSTDAAVPFVEQATQSAELEGGR